MAVGLADWRNGDSAVRLCFNRHYRFNAAGGVAVFVMHFNAGWWLCAAVL
jgi:hypothetical protein